MAAALLMAAAVLLVDACLNAFTWKLLLSVVLVMSAWQALQENSGHLSSVEQASPTRTPLLRRPCDTGTRTVAASGGLEEIPSEAMQLPTGGPLRILELAESVETVGSMAAAEAEVTAMSLLTTEPPQVPKATRASFVMASSEDSSELLSGEITTSEARSLPDTYSRACLACGATSAIMQRCSRCRAAHFCNRSCQLKAWAAGHKEHCGSLATRSGARNGAAKDTKTELPAPNQEAPHGARAAAASSLAQQLMADGHPSALRQAAAMWEEARQQAFAKHAAFDAVA